MTEQVPPNRHAVCARINPPGSPPRGRDAWERLCGWLLCGPGILWLILFCGLPLLALLATSFCQRGPDGEIGLPLTGENYRRLAGFGELGFDAFYPAVLMRSAGLALGTTSLCAVIAIPVALWLSRLAPAYKPAALMLVVIPFWTNLLVRTYGWQLILAPDSWLSRFLQALGWLAPEEGLYPGWSAVFLGMVCDFLPFMILPVYAAAERLDSRLMEAAVDLGANRWQAFRHAVWPQIKPGVTAGALLVFLPAMGQFVVPDLLGGARLMFLGNLLQQQFGPSRDWPFGAAIASVALLLVLLALWLRRGLSGPQPIARA
ncbi:MAG: ABC transporter permease [Verrucomicrobiota bacterium]|nr:ABC transporter permease [Limisphaera sp.]MDW8380671.1 ABC transporter permease [Verrucomicrobiota bacterium]